MDGHNYEGKLFHRGELILDAEFIGNYQSELAAMNGGKEGKPFKLTTSYIRLLAALHYVYGVSFGELEVFARSLGSVLRVPSGSSTALRKRILELGTKPFESFANQEEPLSIELGPTGVSIHAIGERAVRQSETKSKCVKVLFAVSVFTKKVIATEVASDETYTPKATESMVEKLDEKDGLKVSCTGTRSRASSANRRVRVAQKI